jgi:antirestriction protein ArdC
MTTKLTYKELQQQLTDSIIAKAQSGEKLSWVRPWVKGQPSFETSFASGKPYRGGNQILLALTAMEKGYSSRHWITFAAAKKAGGTVRKGERSTAIFKVRFFKEIDKATGQETERKFFGVDRVFNLDQCDGVPSPTGDQPIVLEGIERDAAAELVFGDYLTSSGVKLTSGGDSAHYRPSSDTINLPNADTFTSTSGYYGTAFHEAAHSTGHESRHARDLTGRFGTPSYGVEEITAEVAAAITCATLGLEEPLADQHAAYVQSWLVAVKADPSAITKAISAGWKAADLILGAHAPTYVNRYDSTKAEA